uniref:hypothetical protein n=1 Tax=Tsunamia transpacifica TaxID=1935457 RepID=UPI001BF13ED3|nr:hypothetical protein MW473_pgp028 [Tsunamia transpacifica]QUE27960.1 Ycf19 [Tsunamia transpacifica]UNJ14475.1 hypothetical protein [Tsunamia transpacifica]
MSSINFTNVLVATLFNFLQLYFILILTKITLSWFPNINWYVEPFYTIHRLTRPYLRLFEGTVPIIFGIDCSPTLAIIFLQTLMLMIENIK